MAFTIFDVSNFRSTIDRFGGPAKNNLFQVQIAIPQFLQSQLDTATLTFFCLATTLPGVRIASKGVQRYGIGPMEKMPIGFEFNDLQIQLIGDSNGTIQNFWTAWTRSIVEYSSEGNPGSPPKNTNVGMSGALPYYLNYKSNYETQVSVITYAPTQAEGYSETLLGAYPVDIGDVQLNWGNNDQLMLIPVSLNFRDVQLPQNLLNSFLSSALGFNINTNQILNQVGSVSQILAQL